MYEENWSTKYKKGKVIIIFKRDELKTGEITPIILNENGVHEVVLAIKLDDKCYKEIGYNLNVVEVKSSLLPTPIHGLNLVVVMMMINRSDKLIFRSIWNSYKEKGLFNILKNQNEFVIVIINSETMLEKRITVENDLKFILKEYDKDFMKSIIPNNCSERVVEKVNKEVDIHQLWYSGIMQPQMNQKDKTFLFLRKQILAPLNALMFDLDKCEIENMDFTRIEELLETLESSGVDARGVISIGFDDYVYTLLEVYEINEIREYMKEIFKRHTNLFYFISPFADCNKVIALCLLDINKTSEVDEIYDFKRDFDNTIMKSCISDGFVNYARKLEDYDNGAIELLLSLDKAEDYLY